jgi:hypothetical protein
MLIQLMIVALVLRMLVSAMLKPAKAVKKEEKKGE